MRRPACLLQVAILLSPALACPSAFAWGCKGHQTVALIAEKHLSPSARQLANDLLPTDPGRPNTTAHPCGTTGLDPLASASTWADAVRDKDIDAAWHFIDIPRGAEGDDLTTAFCGAKSCITAAIEAQIKCLKDTHADPKLRAAALRYIIHFVGDIHQPLHCTTNGDRGGNCVPLTYFKTKPKPNTETNNDADDYAPNLHGVWDKEIIEKSMKARGFTTAQAYAAALDAAFQSEFPAWQSDGIHVADWAIDSHQHAEDISYGDLPKLITIDKHPDADVQKCSDNHRIGNRMLHKHIIVGQPYQDEVSEVIDERLAMAGLRLAMILNDAAANLN